MIDSDLQRHWDLLIFPTCEILIESMKVLIQRFSEGPWVRKIISLNRGKILCKVYGAVPGDEFTESFTEPSNDCNKS